MLSFHQVMNVFGEFEGIEKRVASDLRHSFHYKKSLQRGKEVAREIKENKDGSVNGYLSGKYLSEALRKKYSSSIDSRYYISLKSFSRDQLREAIQDVLQSLSNEALLSNRVELNENSVETKPRIETVPSMLTNIQAKADPELVKGCMENWLGYGNGESETWFIGTEESGAEIWRHQTKSLNESLKLRQKFDVFMDFYKVWEELYDLDLSLFRGAAVWRFIAATLLAVEGKPVSAESVRSFIFDEKKLGRLAGNHAMLELFSLPKPTKSSIAPYEHIWNSNTEYVKEVLPSRLALLKDAIKENDHLKLLISYERSLKDLLKQEFGEAFQLIHTYSYQHQTFEFYKLQLTENRSVTYLSTPFFGQGQISYEGIERVIEEFKARKVEI